MDEFDRAEHIWETIRYSRVMDVDDALVERLKNVTFKNLSGLNISEVIGTAKRILKDRGFDIAPLRQLIGEAVDEEKIRGSGRELYVVTYSLSDRQPLSVNVKEVPEGEIPGYPYGQRLSHRLPPGEAGRKYYMDGGGINNVPVDVLAERGYKDIIVLRIYGYGSGHREAFCGAGGCESLSCGAPPGAGRHFGI